jgi:prepilin-type N-terminal cleavage/methylation domain-containing protein
MPSRSNPAWRDPRAGVTLLEMLVVLAVLALIAAVSAAGLRGPSPRLEARIEAARLGEALALARLRAVRLGIAERVKAVEVSCPDAPAPEIVLHPDGTATGGPLCIGPLRHAVDPLDGRLTEVAP